MARLLHALAHLFMLNKCVPTDYRNAHRQWVGGYRCLGCGRVYPWKDE